MAIKRHSAVPGAEKGRRVPISDIPEVQEFADIELEIEALRAAHPEVFVHYADLVDRYNAALERAENAVRQKGVSCGRFDNYSVRVVFDPEKMHEELGEEDFLKCGGSSSQRTVYEVDPDRVNQSIASGLIPTACVDHFTTITRNYKKPKRL